MQVTIPAGMTMGSTVTLNNGQLAELLVAVEKHKKVHALETENTHLHLVNGALTAELRKLALSHEEITLDNENLRRRALPQLSERETQRAIGILKITDTWLGYMGRLAGKKHPARETLAEVQRALLNTIVTTYNLNKE